MTPDSTQTSAQSGPDSGSRLCALLLTVVITVGGTACLAKPSGRDDAKAQDIAPRTSRLVATMLARYPMIGEDNLQVEVVDIARVRELNKVETPDPAATARETNADLMALSPRLPGAKAGADVPPQVRRGTTASYSDFRETFGWSLPDVKAFIAAQPPHPTTMTGSFDRKRLTAALGEPSANELWGTGQPGKLAIDAATRANPVGQPVRIALAEGMLVQGQDDDATSTAAKAATGQGVPTLAQDSAFAALAAALDAAHVYGAVLLRQSSFTARPGRSGPTASAPLPAPFRAIGSGGAADDDGALLVLAWVHADESDAKENATAIKALLAEGSSDMGKRYADLFDPIAVETKRSLVTARLRPKQLRPTTWAEFLIRGQEPLATHQ